MCWAYAILRPAKREQSNIMMLGHNQKMSGAECMADMLQSYGVTHVFHVPAVLRKTFADGKSHQAGIPQMNSETA